MNIKHFRLFKTFTNMQLNDLGDETQEDSIDDIKISINDNKDDDKL